MATQVRSTSPKPAPIDTTITTTAAAAAAAQEDDEANTLLHSPVPLSREEAENAEVRKLAAKLAPVFEATDALFAVPAEFQRATSAVTAITDDDDNMDSELEALGTSEDLLRQELEMAEDFSSLFGPSAATPSPQQQQQTIFLPKAASFTNLLLGSPSEADIRDDDQVEPEQRRLPGSLPPIRIPTPPPGSTTTPTSSPVLKSSSDTSVLLVGGQHTPESPAYTNKDHFAALRMQREERGGWYTVDLTPLVQPGSGVSASSSNTAVVGLSEYVLAIPQSKLRHLFVGLPEIAAKTTPAQPPQLAVRTVSVRIRPDVLCGAVMDAVHHALLTGFPTARVQKRQGGHIRAIVGGMAVVPTKPTTTTTAADVGHSDETMYSEQGSLLSAIPVSPRKAVAAVKHYPPFCVDVQLCTHKTDDCGRMLLLRIYHLAAEDEDPSNDDVEEETGVQTNNVQSLSDEFVMLSRENSHGGVVNSAASEHLRECCALVQRIEAPATAKRVKHSPGRNESFSSQQSTKEVVTEHLMETYRACPSVKEGSITLPGLNSEDWPVVLSSWRFIQSAWEELETRDLTYTTLETSRFGAFPALPTLDVHYCSQIRRLSREAMIVQLLKSASELEEYAREAEFSCANMIALLQPTFETYGIDAPSLPKPVPLTAYPLDFTLPQAACPPWGLKVMEVLNEVQALTGDAGKNDPTSVQLSALQSIDSKKSLDMAKSSVELVLGAFQKQDDEEQSARLGRKNMQVMDRLSKMQAHQRASIQTLQNSSRLSDKAAKAADEFHVKTGFREVPLLKWSIVVGKSTGTCWISANHLLFVTQLIPYIGGNTTTILRIDEVEFTLQEKAPSLLNPLPSIISIKKNGEEVYSFRPSMGAGRLHRFLEVAKGVVLDDPLDVPDAREAVNVDYC